MPQISQSTKKLLQQYQIWYQSLQPKEGVLTIHVDEVASRVAAFYEKINELKKTLSLRNKALKLHPLDMNNLSKILELLKDIKDEEEGKRIFTVLLKSMKQHIIYGKNTDLFRVIDIFCREEKLDCIK